jgi:hypothetical protein
MGWGREMPIARAIAHVLAPTVPALEPLQATLARHDISVAW